MSSLFLALYLDAPMQSWGYQSRFDRRTTLSFPTRSGVFGLICAALGSDRSDARELQEMAKLKMTIWALKAQGRLTDYHTVGGGYDKRTERQHMAAKADGSSPDVVQTYRDYLVDSRFGVALEGDTHQVERIAAALADPAWGSWLGRKSCIPASPVFQGTFVTKEAALAHLEKRAGAKPSRCVIEVETFEDGTDTLMDAPVDFAHRTFTPRRVKDEPV